VRISLEKLPAGEDHRASASPRDATPVLAETRAHDDGRVIRVVRRQSLGGGGAIGVDHCRRQPAVPSTGSVCRMVRRPVRIAPVRAKDVRTPYVQHVGPLIDGSPSRLQARPLVDPIRTGPFRLVSGEPR
jgi:hypothetical protein